MKMIPSICVLCVLWLTLCANFSTFESLESQCQGGNKYSKEANIPELTDEEMFERGHLHKFGSHRPPDHYVEIIPHMIGPEDFYMNYVVKHIPVVIKGAALNWPAYHLWTDEYLMEKYGNVTFQMETKDDDKWNLPSDEKFSDFLKTYQEKNRYLVDEVTPEMREEITMPLCLRCEEIDRYFFVSYYWMSSGGTLSTLHIDTDENLLNVIKGHKKVYMVSPIYSADVYADDTKMLGVSPINTSSVDLEKYPRVKNVRYWVANVEEGDAVFIPQMWWHSVYSRKERQQAVALWWKSKPFWKKISDSVGGPAIPRPKDSKVQGYSFAEALKEYEEWVKNVSSSIPRIKCKEQMVKMSNYHFETDKIENAPQTLGDGGSIEEEAAEQGDNVEEVRKKVGESNKMACDYDITNKKSPCHYRRCKKDDATLKCIRYTLDYCLHFEDRGCVINKPQFLNKLLDDDFVKMKRLKSEFKQK